MAKTVHTIMVPLGTQSLFKDVTLTSGAEKRGLVCKSYVYDKRI